METIKSFAMRIASVLIAITIFVSAVYFGNGTVPGFFAVLMIIAVVPPLNVGVYFGVYRLWADA